ncbi:hypothetical protein ACQP2H_30465 [Micromonospora sp. CA-248260]|uniref:hypothetical protein n=1 Tax=Micromonospora sp. CA-248260 TaxID=3239962 RepID=UPI003D91DE3E
MNDQRTDPFDDLALAARAELDEIQRQVEASWGVEAGLREILLEDTYHRFVDEQAAGFDVAAGLVEVLEAKADLCLPELRIGLFRATIPHPAAILEALGASDEEIQWHLNTFERMRRLADEVIVTIEGLRLDLDEAVDPSDPLGEELMDLDPQFIDAARWALQLRRLAEKLERRDVGLDDALRVVRRNLLAILDLYEGVGSWSVRHESLDSPRRTELTTLATKVNDLGPEIKRLFDPSDDTVGSLL